MSDPKLQLDGLFSEASRFANFGEVLMAIHARGFRCHSETTIRIQSPITALCGLNGTGKSTLLQLASAAYRHPNGQSRYYIRDFFINGTLDAHPAAPGATVVYEYARNPHRQTSAVHRNRLARVSLQRSKWTGYRRQPKREVFFAGVSHSLPKVEERDLVTIFARTLALNGKDELPSELRASVGRILGTSYAAAHQNHVSANGKIRDLISVGRDGHSYSEINMGFGESRVHRLLTDLNKLPSQSLVLLEEPEISLHPSAQHELGKFLIDLCIRMRHQVFLTTHSEYLLRALPARSRIFLHKTPKGLTTIPGIGVGQATSLLANQQKKSLHVLVEDDVAAHIVSELLRRHVPVFLKTVNITPIGSKQDVQTVLKCLHKLGVNACAVRDGDAGASPKDGLFKLWGTDAPEVEMVNSLAVRDMLASRFGVSLEDFFAQAPEADHHQWLKSLASGIPYNIEAFKQLCAETYLNGISEVERKSLVDLITACAP